jgi:hypothetical protein
MVFKKMFPKTNERKLSYLFLGQNFTMQLLDGKKTAKDIRTEIAAEVKQLKLSGKKKRPTWRLSW